MILRYFLVFFVSLWAADAAWAVQSWRILALRVDFPLEEPDEFTTTGSGRFELRSFEEALPDYLLPYDTPPHDRSYFENHLRALARYYRVVSEGEVEIEFEVFPRRPEAAYTLPQTALLYGNGRTTEEIEARWGRLLRDAVALADADAQGPRFADFNSFLVFHAGVGRETGEFNDIRSVYLSPADLKRIFAGAPLAADGGNFVLPDAWILPEAISLRGQAGLNGLLAKFFGNQLGLPGLSNFADGLPALGGWSLMDVGANRLGYILRQGRLEAVLGFVPPQPIAWSKAQLGWIEPLVVKRDTTVSILATDRPGSLPKAVRIPISEDEYFLLENRQRRGRTGVPEGVEVAFDQEGVTWIDAGEVEFSRPDQSGVWLGTGEYDAFVPGSGILVWHVDHHIVSANFAAGTINNKPVLQGIALEEADGFRDIGNPVFSRIEQIEGSPEDPFYVGGHTRFGPQTRPDSRGNTGLDAGIHLEVLSEPGDSMAVRIHFDKVSPGWPLPVEGGRRLQAADVDGDGAAELLIETGRGLRLARLESGFETWELEGARLLAAADIDGDARAELFVARGREVSAWNAGASAPRWSRSLDTVPRAGLVRMGPEGGEVVLAGAEVVQLGARDGALRRRVPLEAGRLLAADVDGDGEVELVLSSVSQGWLLEDGEVKTLWGGEDFLPPVAGDLAADGRAELVLARPEGSVEVRALEGVEFGAGVGDSLWAGPALGDVDGDGFVEIVLAGGEGVQVVRGNGLQEADFPTLLPRFQRPGPAAVPPVLLDVDGDGRQEIFTGTTKGVYALDARARILESFPLVTAGPLRFAPVGADLDGDGMLELAALTGEDLYVWDLQRLDPAYTGAQAAWGQAGGDAAGTRAHAPVPRPRAQEGIGLMPDERVYCYPNPVGGEGQAHLRFFLNRPARMELEVFDSLGERIERIRVEGGLTTPAENEIGWSTRDYASGLYLCRLKARGEDGAKEVAVVKMAVSQ